MITDPPSTDVDGSLSVPTTRLGGQISRYIRSTRETRSMRGDSVTSQVTRSHSTGYRW